MSEPSKPGETPSFEACLAELETIVEALEEGQIPLAEALSKYEAGIQLLKRCYQALEQAERRIELLNRVDSSGRAQGEPFDDSALSLEEKVESRSRRRSREANSQADEIDGPGRLF